MGMAGACSIAQAQETGTPPPSSDSAAKSDQLSEVVVTGSRVARSTFTTPNPVTVLDQQDIQNLGLTNVGEVLGELPQNSNFFAANNVGLGNFNVGAQLANLRGLNPFFGTRTLTLVDTERVVPTATGGGVDVTLIPSMLVARTEVVTGGASAVYGSDAVAGVVNIILDKKLDGLKLQADYGQTSHHDGGDPHVSVGFGHDLFDGRAHFIVGAEYENSEDIGICGEVRSWCANSNAVFTNTGYAPTPPATTPPPNGLPHYIQGSNAVVANQSLTGVLTPCGVVPFPGACIPTGPQYNFNAAGTAADIYVPGGYASGSGYGGPMQGGGAPGEGIYDATTLKPAVKRWTSLANIDFKVTDNLSTFLQVSYARSFAVNPVANGAIGPTQIEEPGGLFIGSSAQINPDNPYLPAQFQPGGANALPAGGALLGYNMNGIAAARNQTDNDTVRVTGGLKGQIGSSSWTYDAYFEYGQNQNNQALQHNAVGTFLQYALDAVAENPALPVGPNNPVVCRATDPTYYPAAYTPAAAGCSPLNLFGANNASAAGLAYAFRTLVEYSTLKEDVISGNIGGDLFSGIGAGPFKASFGAEARRDTADVTHDLADQPFYDEYDLSYGLDYAGKIAVAEGYGEVNAPVLKDLPFVKYLEFDAAIRETDNRNTNETYGAATDGETVTHNIASWKFSSIWDLTDWFRIRGTRSRDVRAAGFRELYENYAVTAGGPFGSVTNPANGLTEEVTPLTGGNINLEPEKADTTTLGLVIAPKDGPLERFQFSADWYRIVLHDPIAGPPTALGIQNIVNLCYKGETQFCDLIKFGTPGDFDTIETINNIAANLGSFQTRGVDFESSYRLPLPEISNSLNGSLSFRLLTSLLYNMTIDDGLGSGPINYAGQSGPTGAFGGFNTSPRWQSNFFVTYATGPLTATAQLRWIGRGTFETLSADGGIAVAPGDPGYVTTNPNSINNNSVASATYLNLSGSYDFTKNFSFFASINNVLNKDPPVAPGGNGYPTNPVYFDTYGMFWRVGFRAKF